MTIQQMKGQSSGSITALLRVSVASAGILAGLVVGVWLTEVSLGPAAELWIRYHQAIRTPYTVVVPPLGALAVVGAVVTLFRSRSIEVDQPAIVTALVCLTAGMVVTIGVHFPMNAAIDTWSPSSPPPDWEQVRRHWFIAHSIRSLLALAAFGSLVAAARGRKT